MIDQEKQRKSNIILITGVIFNFSIGILYAWGELKKHLMLPVEEGGWGWTSSQAGLPYTIAAICFAVAVLIGGRIQDKVGPRWVLTTGGTFVGLGLILSSLVGNSPSGFALCFGIITGFGIGLGISSITPPALKWFHPGKKGFVSGFVLGGFGMGAVFYAPLVAALLACFSAKYGYDAAVGKTLLYLGIAIMIISVSFAQFIRNPPAGYIPVVPKNIKRSAVRILPSIDYTWREMVKTNRFYLMSILLLFSTTVGLMVIGNTSKIANVQIGITDTAFLLSLMAIMNGTGRVVGGIISDKIGRTNTLLIVIILQLFNMIGFVFYQNLAGLLIGIIVTGFCYGSILSIIPSMTADQFGIKNYGVNYGIVCIFWGLAGFVAPLFTDHFFDMYGNFIISYIICAALMPIMIFVIFLLKKEVAKVSEG